MQIGKVMNKIKNKIGQDNFKSHHFIEKNILPKNDRLIMLTKTGSHLYGTETPESDIDLKGIFVPSKRSVILKNDSMRYGPYSSNTDDEGRNDSDDVDLELISIYQFFDSLKKGDTNAYDLLFAYKNKKAIYYADMDYVELFENRKKLIGSKPIRHSFIGYAYGQYKRYELKGLNFNTLRFILRYFKNIDYIANDRLRDYAEKLINQYKEEHPDINKDEVEEQLKIYSDDKDIYLLVNDYKSFPLGIRIKQLVDSLQKWANQYGARVKNNDGIDYKSIYHAFRVLNMAKDLAKTCDIDLPITGKEYEKLMSIRNQNKDYKKLVQELEKKVEVVGDLLEKSDKLPEKPETDYIIQYLEDVYQENSTPMEEIKEYV